MLFQTVTAVNYLPVTLVFARLLRQHIPGARLCILVTDVSQAKLDDIRTHWGDLASFIGCDDLGIPAIADMRRYYSIFEFCSACKVLALGYQLIAKNEPECCFIDPDMLVMGDFTPEIRETNKDIAVTYHTTAPYPADGQSPTELELVASGAINGGLLYMRRSPQSLEALNWLIAQTRHNWFVAPAYGMFGDQHWLGFLPQFFGNITAILQSPAINIAYWNLHERPLREAGGVLTARDVPAKLFHFSGFPQSSQRLSKHSNRIFDAQTEGCLTTLIARYRDAIATEQAAAKLAGDLAFSRQALHARMKLAETLCGHRFAPLPTYGGRFARLGAAIDRLLG
jgi:hypothetical protein